LQLCANLLAVPREVLVLDVIEKQVAVQALGMTQPAQRAAKKQTVKTTQNTRDNRSKPV
jgi:hypothetical protein